jgi:hypothetical protein
MTLCGELLERALGGDMGGYPGRLANLLFTQNQRADHIPSVILRRRVPEHSLTPPTLSERRPHLEVPRCLKECHSRHGDASLVRLLTGSAKTRKMRPQPPLARASLADRPLRMGEWQEAFSLPRSSHQLVALAPSVLLLRAKDLRGAANAVWPINPHSAGMAIKTSLRVSAAIRRGLANQS